LNYTENISLPGSSRWYIEEEGLYFDKAEQIQKLRKEENRHKEDLKIVFILS